MDTADGLAPGGEPLTKWWMRSTGIGQKDGPFWGGDCLGERHSYWDSIHGLVDGSDPLGRRGSQRSQRAYPLPDFRCGHRSDPMGQRRLRTESADALRYLKMRRAGPIRFMRYQQILIKYT